MRQTAYRDAMAAGSSAAEAEAIGTAAMVAVAALAEAPSPVAETGTIGISVGDVDVVVSVSARMRRPAAGSRSLDTRQPSLLSLSRAVRTPIVDAAIQSRRTTVRQLS